MAEQHIVIENDPTQGIQCLNEFAIADTWYIDSYTEDTWNGIAGNLSRFFSDTSGSQATLDLSLCGDIGSGTNPLEYVDFDDINFTGGYVYANYKTCTGKSDNNSGIIWIGTPKGGNICNDPLNFHQITLEYGVM